MICRLRCVRGMCGGVFFTQGFALCLQQHWQGGRLPPPNPPSPISRTNPNACLYRQESASAPTPASNRPRASRLVCGIRGTLSCCPKVGGRGIFPQGRDVVFQFVDDFFKQRDVKSAPHGEFVTFLELRGHLHGVGYAFSASNKSFVSA